MIVERSIVLDATSTVGPMSWLQPSSTGDLWTRVSITLRKGVLAPGFDYRFRLTATPVPADAQTVPGSSEIVLRILAAPKGRFEVDPAIDIQPLESSVQLEAAGWIAATEEGDHLEYEFGFVATDGVTSVWWSPASPNAKLRVLLPSGVKDQDWVLRLLCRVGRASGGPTTQVTADVVVPAGVPALAMDSLIAQAEQYWTQQGSWADALSLVVSLVAQIDSGKGDHGIAESVQERVYALLWSIYGSDGVYKTEGLLQQVAWCLVTLLESSVLPASSDNIVGFLQDVVSSFTAAPEGDRRRAIATSSWSKWLSDDLAIVLLRLIDAMWRKITVEEGFQRVSEAFYHLGVKLASQMGVSQPVRIAIRRVRTLDRALSRRTCVIDVRRS